MTKVIIHVSNGTIQHILSDNELDVLILDEDEGGREDAVSVTIYPSEGKEAYLPVWAPVEHNPHRVERIMEEI